MSFLIFILSSSTNIFRAGSQATGCKILDRYQPAVSLSQCSGHIHAQANSAKLHWLGGALPRGGPCVGIHYPGLATSWEALMTGSVSFILLNDNSCAIL